MTKTKKRQLIFLVFAIVIAALVAITSACAKQEAAPQGPAKVVKFLYPTDLTGPAASAYVPLTEGLTDMEKYLNDQGQIKGVKVELTTVDTKYQLALGQSAYERYKDEVVGVVALGYMMDWLVEKVPNDKKVVESLSPTPKSMFPAQPYIYAFMLWPPDATAAGLKWYRDSVWKKDTALKVAVLLTDSAAGKASLLGIPKWCKDQKIEIVATKAVPLGATDASAELMSLRQLNPDLIYVATSADVCTVALKNRRDLGINIPFLIATIGDLDIPMRAIGPEPLEGVYWIPLYAFSGQYSDKFPQVKMAMDWWTKKHPNTPYVGYYGLGAGFTMVRFEAVKRALEKVPFDKLTGETLKQYGYDSLTKNFDVGGLFGGFSIEPGVDHFGLHRVQIAQCKNGKIIQIADFFEVPKIRPPFE